MDICDDVVFTIVTCPFHRFLTKKKSWFWKTEYKNHKFSAEKATKFGEIFPLLNFDYSKYLQSKVRGRFLKILWPSQNIWTLNTKAANIWEIKSSKYFWGSKRPKYIKDSNYRVIKVLRSNHCLKNHFRIYKRLSDFITLPTWNSNLQWTNI